MKIRRLRHATTPSVRMAALSAALFAVLLAGVLTSPVAGAPAKGRAAGLDERAGDALASLLETADAAWARRPDAAALAGARAHWEQALALTEPGDPRQVAILLRLARADYLEAELLLPLAARPDDEVAAAHRRVVDWAERALALACPAYATCRATGGTAETCSPELTREAVPAATYYAGSLARASRLTGVAAMWEHRGTIRAFAGRLVELDDRALVGAPLRLLAAVEATTPVWLGGDLGRAAALFERAVALYPRSISNRLAFAEHWATRAGRRDRFEQLLQEAIVADPHWAPEMAIEEAARQELARRLLARADELFPTPPPALPSR